MCNGHIALYRVSPHLAAASPAPRALPTIGGEAVRQMKCTVLVATITVVDIDSLALRVTQDTFFVYEPLSLLAVVSMIMVG